MSLGVSPNTPSPILTRPAKPNGAHRKRGSMSSSRASPALPLSPAMSSGGVLGGLRERSEDELQRASRGEMELALREEWANREELLERLNALEANQRNLQSERNELSKVVVLLQGRVDEAFKEQQRLEVDLEGRDQVLDRLRLRVGEGERSQRELQKRYTEQEKSFEAERDAFRAQESQLQSRVNSLRSRLEHPAPAQAVGVSAAEDELVSLQASHTSLLARLNTISKDMVEMRTRNAQLEEDNAGWELLMRERTMSGRVLDAGLFNAEDPSSLPQSPAREKRARRKSRKSRGELEKLDEETELEEEMDDLHSDLEMQSPILGSDADSFTGRRRGGEDEAHKVGGLLAPPGRVRRAKGESLGDLPVTGRGLDLAAELGRAEMDLSGDEMRVLARGDESEALRAEVKQLREANKALTLYCSKIIDRLITHDGFEQILSVDYRTRRGLRTSSASSSASGMSSTIKKPKTRPSLKDITHSTQDIPQISQAAMEEPPKKEKKEKKARPLSMMFRSSSSMATETIETVPEEVQPAAPAAVPEEETKAEKRARRGFSLDLRSFGFGASPIESPKPRLKPLTLPKRTSTLPTAPKAGSSASVTPASSIGHSIARKCDVEEEDEDDRRERHRLEASLKLMGIDRAPSPSAFEDLTGNDQYWATPRLGSSGAERSGQSAHERDLERGDEVGEITSPRRATRRRHVEAGKVVKSESISTLWSMGSGGSRPGSREVAPGEVEHLR